MKASTRWGQKSSILSQPRGKEIALFLLAIAAAAGIFLEIFRIPEKHFFGFGPLVQAMMQAQQKGDVLISSDPSGEGAFITELALNDHRPGWRAHRASKLVGESDWIGRDYRLRFANAQALSEFLGQSNIGWIVSDSSLPKDRQQPHHLLLEESLREGAAFTETGKYPMRRRQPAPAGAMESVLFQRN